jgi:hypothetical protein
MKLSEVQVKELLSLLDRAPGGKLSAGEVVKAAQKKSSNLHRLFEWDDARAALKARVAVGRQVLESFEVVLRGTNSNGKEEQVRVPGAVSIGRGWYCRIERAVADEDVRTALVISELKQLDARLARFSSILTAADGRFTKAREATDRARRDIASHLEPILQPTTSKKQGRGMARSGKTRQVAVSRA